jgi:glycosyltransferase involved in cell wall biosynthesis
MKKVLFITLRSDTGGGPKHLLDLTSNLSDVEINIAAPMEEPFGKLFKEKAKEFIELKHRSFSIVSFFKILLFCKEKNIECVHSHGRGAGIYSRLLNFFGIKVVHTFHGAHFEDTLIGRVKVFVDKLFKNSVNHYICVSQDEKKKASEIGILGSKPVTIINNGVSIPEKISPMSLDVENETIVFGTLARLSYQKGIDQLIEFLKNKDFPSNWQFVIAGDGEDSEILKSKVNSYDLNDRIKFLGNITTPLNFLESIDIYFSTSRWEGLPLGVLEAMSLKKPCILSNVEGHVEFNKYGEAVLLYKDFLTDCHRIVDNKDKYSNLAFTLVADKFSVEEMAKETEKTYR